MLARGPYLAIRDAVLVNRDAVFAINGALLAREEGRRRVQQDLIWTSIHDKNSGSTKINTHLDHMSHHKTTPCTNWSNKWTYRVVMINTRRN